MTFTYEIPGYLVDSVKLYLATRVEHRQHPTTGMNMVVSISGHDSPENFFKWLLDRDVHEIAKNYPMGPMLEHMTKIKALEEEAKKTASVSVVSGSK